MEVSMAARLYIEGLPRGFDEDDLLDLCEPYGDVYDAQILDDEEDGKGRCRGVVDYEDLADARSAADELDGYELQGRSLKASYSERDRSQSAFD
jgi:nucleolin